MSKRFLIVGGGSMGRRRIRCLAANHVAPEQIRVVDVRPDRRGDVLKRHQVESLPDLDAGLAWGPDAVFVCVYPEAHLEICLAAARAGKHVFCEVPLAIEPAGIDELVRLAETKPLVVAPACQVPFHPLVRQAKQWLDEPAFPAPLICHFVSGQYLPDWHPYEDYGEYFAAASQKTGGVSLDVIAMYLTSLYWMIGDRFSRLYCEGSRLSTLAIDGCDCHQIIARSAGGMVLTYQSDLIRRVPEATLQIINEQGTVEVGLDRARRFLKSAGRWETVGLPEGFQYEQCYVDEVTRFLECLEGRAEWLISLETAVDVIRFWRAAEKSAATGGPVDL